MINFIVTVLFRIESLHITMASHTSRNLLRRLIQQLKSLNPTRMVELGRLLTSQLCEGRYFRILMKDSLSTVQGILTDLLDICEQTETLNDEYEIACFAKLQKYSGYMGWYCP